MTDTPPKLEQGFTIKNGIKLMDIDDKNQLWALEQSFKGRDYFRVMSIWRYADEDFWRPGKGFGVPLAKKAELIEALKKIA
jgi:hypothetical protein